MKLIKGVKIKLYRATSSVAETKEAGGSLTLCSPHAFLQTTSFHLPFCVVVHLSQISFHIFIYSFFFSFCLSSLLISLLAMDAYLVITPCWFRPGSSSRKLTIR